MRAVLYARFSTDLQSKDSISDQYRSCERVAVANGLTIVNRFGDEGVSGGTADRAGYQALLGAARSGAFDIVIAEDLSRLWRSRAEFGPRSAEFEDLGVHLLTCTGDDTRRDGYGLILAIKSAMAEHQRREISYRTCRGMEGLALSGQSTGGKEPYGYRGGRIHEPEAAVIRCIFTMAHAGMSLGFIAANLNAKNDRPELGQVAFTPSGGLKWARSSVAAILAHARYTGAVVWGATESYGGARDSKLKKRRMRSGGPLVKRTDPALEIIPEKMFLAVQNRLQGRTARGIIGSIEKLRSGL
jgi:site-specific DNA recombinase